MKNKILTILGVIFLLSLAYVAGHYRVLPADQLRPAIEYVENLFGSEEIDVPRQTEDVEFLNTHLTRLLMKKVPLQFTERSGGGLSASGDLLFISSNKGEILVFETENYIRLEGDLSSPPLNFEGLVESGHATKNSFRSWWFRVNGVFSEQTGENSYTLYVSHNYYDSERDCISHNVSKTNVIKDGGSVAQLEEWTSLFAAEPCFDPAPAGFVSAVPYSGHISGGAIQDYDEDHLLITVGDYNHHGLGNMPKFAQDPETPYGKFVLLNKQTGDWSVYASGSRNPSGLFIDDNSTIWAVENGPEAGDELNVIREGANYGWPVVSYGIWYTEGYAFSDSIDAGRHTGFEEPAYSWIPAIAPSSILRLQTERFPLWRGDFLVGAMRGQGVRRLRLNRDSAVVYDEEIHLGHRIRDIDVLKNGIIVLLTDDHYLILLDDGGPSFEDPAPDVAVRMETLKRFDNMISGQAERADERTPAMVYDQHCASCHLLNRRSEIGPHLNELIGREIGGIEDYTYSGTLSEDSRKWTVPLLRSFLTEPEREFSGNRMNKIELTNSEVNKLIRFFESQKAE